MHTEAQEHPLALAATQHFGQHGLDIAKKAWEEEQRKRRGDVDGRRSTEGRHRPQIQQLHRNQKKREMR